MSFWPTVLSYFAGDTPYNYELRAFGIALQGAMAVRNGPNKDGKMHWFHAMALTSILGFGGGWMGFIWMGKPTSMIVNGDVNIAICLLAFVIANYTPFDIGYKLANTLPVKIVYTALAQLFRSLGMIGFITQAFNEVKPSVYYPTPILGPVIYGCLLGNMGGFLVKGFDGHLKNGIPWPFQNGLVVGALFHLFAHDEEGPLGTFLRKTAHSIGGEDQLLLGLDDRAFAIFLTGGFMFFTGIIMLPEFMGPSFSPIIDPCLWVRDLLTHPFKGVDTFPDDKDVTKEAFVQRAKSGQAKASNGKRRKPKRKKA